MNTGGKTKFEKGALSGRPSFYLSVHLKLLWLICRTLVAVSFVCFNSAPAVNLTSRRTADGGLFEQLQSNTIGGIKAQFLKTTCSIIAILIEKNILRC